MADINGDQQGDLGDRVILEQGLSPQAAQILCGCLRMAGIQADTGDTDTVQANRLWTIALGGAKVRVPTAQLDEAREVAAAYRRGDFELGDDFDEGEGGAAA